MATLTGVVLGAVVQLASHPASRTGGAQDPGAAAPRRPDQTRLARVSYDGDSRSDIAVQTLGVPGSLRVFTSQHDRFAAPREWARVPGTINGVRPSRLNRDFNGDGNTDAVKIATDGSAAEISVLLSNGHEFGNPRVWGDIAGVGGPEDVFASGDYNGDGRSDLAVTHAGSTGVDIEVLLSRGSSFAPAQNWARGLSWDVDYLRLMPGDYDNDGRADLLDAGPGTSPWSSACSCLEQLHPGSPVGHGPRHAASGHVHPRPARLTLDAARREGTRRRRTNWRPGRPLCMTLPQDQTRSCTTTVASRSGPTPIAEIRAPDISSTAST